MPDSDDAHDERDERDERANRTTALDERDDDAHADPTSSGSATDDSETAEVPPSVVDEAERLTRLAREAVDDDEAAAYRADREERLDAHDFSARVRDEDDAGETLVLHPEEWVEDDMIRPERVDDVDRAIEVPLSGTGDPDDWAAVDAHNRELVARVREAHGDPHATVVDALADFASNHYAKPIDELTASELREFEGEYVARNAWLDDDEVAAIEGSVRYAFDAAGERVPDW